MNNKQIFGVVLIIAGLILAFVGYQKSQATAVEKIAGNASKVVKNLTDLTGTTDREEAKKIQSKVDGLSRERYQRSIPFYIGGAAVILVGLLLLKKSPFPSN